MKRLLVLLGFLSLSARVFADVPPQIGFEATFSSTGTLPLIQFRIVDSTTSDSALASWVESTAPYTTDGRVSLLLGAQTPIPPQIFQSSQTTRFLWIKVGTEPPLRQKLVSVPFAFRAGQADRLSGGSVTGGSLTIQNDTQALTVVGGNDQIILKEQDGPLDEKRWIIKADLGDLSLLTSNDNGTSFAEVMKVERTGVDVGRVRFQRNLEVNGALRVTGTGINKDIEINSPIRATINPIGPNVPPNQDFQIRSAGSGTMQINNDNPGNVSLAVGGGKVGVGTPSPSDKLTVAGTVRSLTGGFKFPDGTVQTTASTGGGGGGVLPSSDVNWTGVHTWAAPATFNNQLEVNGALRITGTGINKDIEINSPIRATINPIGPNVPPDQDFQIRSAGGGTMQVNNDNPGNVSLAVGGGKVGVGTPDPAEKLTVTGTIQSTEGGFKFPDGTVQVTAAGGGGGGVQPSSDVTWTGVHTWQQPATFNGWVGIGTYSPGKELEVNGALRITGTGINKDIELNSPIRATINPIGPNVPPNQDFQIRSAGGGTMQVNNDNPGNVSLAVGGGKVGVGTPSPAERLSVAGTIQSMSGGFKFPDGTVQTTAAQGGIQASSTVTWTGAHTWKSAATFEAGARLADRDLTLRAGSDLNHGLGWYGQGKTFTGFGQELDGPVLYGWNGGGLGFKSGGDKLALRWSNDGKVWLESKSTTNPNEGWDSVLAFRNTTGVQTGGPHMGEAIEPTFLFGNVWTAAGDGAPNFRVYYQDKFMDFARSVLNFDSNGVVASVKPEMKTGSHFEGFVGGGRHPVFRLSSDPVMQLEMGSGAVSDAQYGDQWNGMDVALRRAGPGVFSLLVGSHTFLQNSWGDDDTEALRVTSAGTFLNNRELLLRREPDANHGLKWAGAGQPFAGLAAEGPAIFGWNGGLLGSRAPDERIALRWTSAGNVGIGTVNPGEKLTVAGTIHSTAGGFKFPDGSVQATAASGGGIQPSSDITWTGTHVWQSSAAFAAGARVSDKDLWLRNGADKNHGLGWYGSGKPFQGVDVDGPVLYGWSGGALGTKSPGDRIALSWTNAGRVGIGTASPETELHVKEGNAMIEGDGEQELAFRRNDLAGRPSFRFGRMIYGGDGAPNFRIFYSDDQTPERTVLDFDNKGILASVRHETGSHFEAFVADGSGQEPLEPVFRLNSTPAMQLEMGPGGNGLTDVAVRRVGANTLGFFNRAGGEAPHMQTETVRISSNGYVGIGTPNPESKLDVEGDVRVNNNHLWLRAGNDNNHGLGWFGPGKTFAGAAVEGPVLFGWNGGALGSRSPGDGIALAWNSAGNVGVGTTTPAAKFQVSGGDVAVTTQGKGLILKATDGNGCYRLTVNGAGVLGVTAVPCP
ncbi:MAG: hypothetical protein ACT4O3_04470 [Elusimicrobiota bacterium]